jgi:hypothetical protein
MSRSAILKTLAAVALCGWLTSCGLQLEPKGENTGILNKKTQNIGKFDPNAEQRVSDQKIQATDPITAPLAAYGPMMEKVSILAVDQAINLFRAENDRYPKDHAEFMEKIIKANRIALPVLPYGGEYKYDETEHCLKAVYPPKDQGKPGGN